MAMIVQNRTNGVNGVNGVNGTYVVDKPAVSNGHYDEHDAHQALGVKQEDCCICAKAYDEAWFKQQIKRYLGVADPHHHNTDDLWNLLFRIREQQNRSSISNELMVRVLIDMLRHYSDQDPREKPGPPPPPPPPPPKNGTMFFTTLGSILSSSSHEQVATLGDIPSLPRAATIDISKRVTGYTECVAQAPQFDPNHLKPWQDFIKSGQSNSELHVHGEHLPNAGLVMLEDNGKPAKLMAGPGIAEEIRERQKLSNSTKGASANAAVLSMASEEVNESLLIDSLETFGSPTASFRNMKEITPTISRQIPMQTKPQPQPQTSSPMMAPQPQIFYSMAASQIAPSDSSIPTDPTGLTTVPDGYMLAGDIKLFNSIEATRYVFKGDDDKSQMVTFSKSALTLDNLLQPQGFSYGDILLQNPQITFYNQKNTSQRAVGIWLDAALVLNEKTMDGASTALKDIFATTSPPTLMVKAKIGDWQKLSDALKAPETLKIMASIQGLDAKLGKFLELTSVEIDISGSRVQPSGYAWTTQLTGNALLTVPGSVAPLVATYTVSKKDSSYEIELVLKDTWDSAMGVPGFHLTDAKVKASFETQAKDKAFTFSIDAQWALGKSTFHIVGNYDSDGWSFHADMPGTFSLQQIRTAYEDMYKAPLSECNHNAVFSELQLDLDSKKKSLVFQGKVAVESSFTSSAISLSVGPTGLHMLAGVDGDVTLAKGIVLTQAEMTLIVSKNGLIDPSSKTPGISAAFQISGALKIGDLKISAQVSFAKDAKSTLYWVVYAKATTAASMSGQVRLPKDTPASSLLSTSSSTTPSQATKLSHFIGDFGAATDISLPNFVVMASNAPKGNELFPTGLCEYPIENGFNLYATVPCPPEIAKVLRSTNLEVTLEVALDKDSERIEFIFGTPPGISLRPGLIAPRVIAGVDLKNRSFFIEGDVEFMVTKPKDRKNSQLDLSLGFKFLVKEAQGTATLTSVDGWADPFGISERLVIDTLSLQLDFDYAALTYPSGIGFAGKFMVGETSCDLALAVNENPEDGVILVHIEDLDIHDVVKFAGLLIHFDNIPAPARKLIVFEDYQMGISTGGSIGGRNYPAGISFYAKMRFFGESIDVKCLFDKSLPGLTFHAELGQFHLGPVAVSGRTTPNPTLDLEISKDKQQFSVDGQVELFGAAGVALTTTISMKPDWEILVDADLHFTDILLFKLHGLVKGDVTSIKSLKDAQIDFSAELDQSIINQILALANTYITVAKKAADEKFAQAENKLDATKKAYQDHLSACQRDLTNAEGVWEKKQANQNALIAAKRDDMLKQEQAKQADVDRAKAAFNQKVAEAEASLDREKALATTKVQNAQNELARVRNVTDQKIHSAKDNLNTAQNHFTNSFGNAKNAIENAERAVGNEQKNVDSLQGKINDCRNRIKNDHWWKRPLAAAELPGLYAAFGAATGALKVAQGILAAASGVVQGPAYKIAEAAITMAEGVLTAANAAANAELKVASDALEATKISTKFAITAAEKTLETAQKASDELRVFNLAKAALDLYVKGKADMVTAVEHLVSDLQDCAEKLKFDAAKMALAVASSATKELDAAKDLLKAVDGTLDAVSDVFKWLVNSVGNILNITKVSVSGSLHDKENPQPLSITIVGKFCDGDINWNGKFVPGHGEDMVKELMKELLADAAKDIAKFVHKKL